MTSPGPLLARRPAVAAGALVVLVALAVAAAVDHSALLLHVDRPIEDWVQRHRSPAGNTTFRAVTFLGSSAATYPGGAVLAVLAALRSRPAAVFVVVATALRPVVETVFKASVGRARPVVAPAVHGASFPSGHVLGSTVLVCSALTVAALYVHGPPARRALVALGALVLLAVGVSRVYLGYHWPTDVLGGWLTGGLFLAVVELGCRRAFGGWPGRHPEGDP